MKIKMKFETALEKYCYCLLLALMILISLAPLAVAITFAIFFSPWCLFVLTTYIFLGPIFLLGIHACWDIVRSI